MVSADTVGEERYSDMVDYLPVRDEMTFRINQAW